MSDFTSYLPGPDFALPFKPESWHDLLTFSTIFLLCFRIPCLLWVNTLLILTQSLGASASAQLLGGKEGCPTRLAPWIRSRFNREIHSDMTHPFLKYGLVPKKIFIEMHVPDSWPSDEPHANVLKVVTSTTKDKVSLSHFQRVIQVCSSGWKCDKCRVYSWP